jgi:hypothetical protein
MPVNPGGEEVRYEGRNSIEIVFADGACIRMHHCW